MSNGAYSDVVGALLSWADGELTVRRKDDTIVTLAEADLVAGKVVPPAPPPRRPRSAPDPGGG